MFCGEKSGNNVSGDKSRRANRRMLFKNMVVPLLYEMLKALIEEKEEQYFFQNFKYCSKLRTIKWQKIHIYHQLILKN